MLTQALDVRPNRLTDQLLDLTATLASGDTPGKSGTHAPQLVGPCS